MRRKIYDKLKEWISWVVSTDRDQATGDALEAPVTYDGTEYTLEFTKRTVAALEQQGFVAGLVGDKPMTITWAMQNYIPGFILDKAQKMAVG